MPTASASRVTTDRMSCTTPAGAAPTVPPRLNNPPALSFTFLLFSRAASVVP